jgi:hypothetical protein
MTARKPPNVGWTSWVEMQIREAQERGEFDNLPGAGKPIPGINDPPDEMWWVKQWLKREELSYTPPTLAIRKAREDFLDQLGTFRTEEAVRKAVGELNVRIREVNSKATSGPPSTVVKLDPERVVAMWTERRTSAESH